MIRNYVIVALRNLSKHRFFSSINIFGLAISMSVCLGIIMLVADQLEYDKYNSKKDRVYRVLSQNVNQDGTPAGKQYATVPLPVGPTLVNEFTGVEKSVRIRRGFGNGWIEFDQDLSIPLGGFFTDPEFLDVFDIELEYGDPASALRDPYSVVLTRKAADKLFSNPDPTGEIIKVGKLGEYKVTGVIRDNDHKSHIVYEALASFSTLPSLESNNTFISYSQEWGNYTAGWVYILLKEGTSPHTIQQHLNKMAEMKKSEPGISNEKHSYRFYLQSLTAITPGPFINNPIGPFMPEMFVYFFGGLALLVMGTSCFNYTSLSIARALSRAREIGVRKVNGANRYQIFMQFLCEAVLLSLVALGFALILLIAVKPVLLNLKFAQVLRWDLGANLAVYASFVGFSVLVGLMAGFFPAVVLSRLEPIKVLKKIGSLKLFSRLTLRKSLLVFQFCLSLIFIISVLVVFNQLQLFMKADHGFEMDGKYVVKLNSTSYENLKNELEKYGSIVNSAGASHVPAAGIVLGEGYKRDPADPDYVSVDYFNVDADYINNMSIELIAGRNFNKDTPERNATSVVLNEKAVKVMSFETPHDAIGQYLFASEDSAKYEIVGVVKDYNHQILVSNIGPMVLRYKPSAFSILQVKYAADPTIAAADIEKAWKTVNPNQNIDYKSFEEEVRGFYKTIFSDFVTIIGIICVMAVIISCLGLLGMATYSIETRLKEISIRKVLGSTSNGLVILLSKGFLLLLSLAVVLAVPIAWFINNLWLEKIAYRTEIGLDVIGVSVLILFVLGTLTIGSQTFRAAFSNPITNLKNE